MGIGAYMFESLAMELAGVSYLCAQIIILNGQRTGRVASVE